MRRLSGVVVAAASALLLAGVVIASCGPNVAPSSPTTAVSGSQVPGTSPADPIAGVATTIARASLNDAEHQIEAVLGLRAGAVSRSSEAAALSSSDLTLRWDGGRAEVDQNTGRIRMIIVSGGPGGSGASLSDSALDQTASQVAETLGWANATLAAEGFSSGGAKRIDHGDAGTEYVKTWSGRDKQGLPNQAIIEVGLSVTTGNLVHFFCVPGPQDAASSPVAVSKDEAVEIALEAVGDNPPGDPMPQVPGEPTTTAPPLGIVVTSTELVHTSAPGVTGGKDMLVWIVKLGGYDRSGKVHATVYIDGVTGDVLLEMY